MLYFCLQFVRRILVFALIFKENRLLWWCGAYFDCKGRYKELLKIVNLLLNYFINLF